MNRAIVRCAVLAFFLAALPLAAQSGDWTAVGSTGAIADLSLGIYGFNGPALQHRAGVTGTVLANYNVTNTFGGGLTDTPPWNTLEVTWFDNSPSSAIAAVLMEVDRCTGAVTVLCNVSAVDNPAITCNSCNFPAGSINFVTSSYFVQVRLARSVNTVTPQVIALRIF
jgi:hypothetical protein